LRTQVGQVLRVAQDRVPSDEPLTAIGLDSMMAVELRERVRVALDLHLPLLSFFGGATITSLVARLVALLPAAPDPLEEGEEMVL